MKQYTLIVSLFSELQATNEGSWDSPAPGAANWGTGPQIRIELFSLVDVENSKKSLKNFGEKLKCVKIEEFEKNYKKFIETLENPPKISPLKVIEPPPPARGNTRTTSSVWARMLFFGFQGFL